MNDVLRAQRAYEAYFEDAEGKTFDVARCLPGATWAAVQRHWAAAAAALDSSFPRPELDPREAAQVRHALDYENHVTAFLSGHNQYMLVAKLARALGL